MRRGRVAAAVQPMNTVWVCRKCVPLTAVCSDILIQRAAWAAIAVVVASCDSTSHRLFHCKRPALY